MVILFDVNGTILDTRALEPEIRKIFGKTLGARDWFVEVVQYAMASSLAGSHFAFEKVAQNVLRMRAEAQGVRLSRTQLDRVRQCMLTLPPFRDVKRGLDHLRNLNVRLAVLTNSSERVLQEQLQHAGLARYFDRTLTVEQVRRFKPAPEPYQMAASALGVSTGEVLMVAAHPWDLLGAAKAGCRTALILRPGTASFPLAPTPTYLARDFTDLARQLASTTRTTPAGSPSRLATGAAIAGLCVTAALGLTSAFARKEP